MHAYSLSRKTVCESLSELIGRAGSGDQGAFTELDGMYRKRVNGFLARACGDRCLADELTNETFMRVYKSLGGYNGCTKQQFQSFLFTISANLLRDHLRRRPAPKALGEDQAEQIESEYNSDESLEAKERQQMLRQAMNKLTADEAMMISLAHLKDIPAEEIAQVLGKPSAQAVRAALCRAMKHLREILVQQGYFTQLAT